jgi:osmotically-inducible protein OsmY
MIPVMSTDEFSRCDERIQPREPGKSPSLTARSDASLQESVERAIWKDEVLRAIEYYEIDVRAKNGIVHLNGHITNSTSRIRIENAIRSVPGMVEVRNHLVLDDNLTLEVAGALGILEHRYGCKFFTGSSHGVISISGVVSNENVKLMAERCAAENPNVRGVINHLRVSGALEPEPQDLPVLQPAIGETIYFLDGPSGVVKRVVINPNNRRVIAMTLEVDFTEPQLPLNSLSDGRTSLPIQFVNVPLDAVRYLTKGSGFLRINSKDRSRYQDFDSASFFTPGADWTPPYPYCPQDVLFPVESQKADAQTADIPHPFPIEGLLEGVPYQEQSFATDHLGS